MTVESEHLTFASPSKSPFSRAGIGELVAELEAYLFCGAYGAGKDIRDTSAAYYRGLSRLCSDISGIDLETLSPVIPPPWRRCAAGDWTMRCANSRPVGGSRAWPSCAASPVGGQESPPQRRHDQQEQRRARGKEGGGRLLGRRVPVQRCAHAHRVRGVRRHPDSAEGDRGPARNPGNPRGTHRQPQCQRAPAAGLSAGESGSSVLVARRSPHRRRGSGHGSDTRRD